MSIKVGYIIYVGQVNVNKNTYVVLYGKVP